MQKIKKIIEIKITQKDDVFYIRKWIIEFAGNIGFSEIEQYELELIISELGTSLIEYSNNHVNKYCQIKVGTFTDMQGTGIEIVVNNGTPITTTDNLREWIRSDDKTSRPIRFKTSTIEIDLSIICRIADSFDIKEGQDGSLDITIRKLLREKHGNSIESFVLSQPKNGNVENGDKYLIKQRKHCFDFCIIDALGHGINAQQVAQKAMDVIQNYEILEIHEIVNECNKALKNTRGAALCIGKINLMKNIVEFTSIGNIESRIYGKNQIQFDVYNGTIGNVIDYYKIDNYPFKRGDCLIAYTDGISNSFVITKKMLSKSAHEIGSFIINSYSKNYDDATVLVAKV